MTYQPLIDSINNNGFLTYQEWINLFDLLPFLPDAEYGKSYFKSTLTPAAFITVSEYERMVYSIALPNVNPVYFIEQCEQCGNLFSALLSILTALEECPMFPLKDLEGNLIPSIVSIGVFDVNNNYLGDAINTGEFIDLWNSVSSNVDDYGIISETAYPTVVKLAPVTHGITPVQITAMRKYTVECNGGGRIYGNANTILLSPSINGISLSNCGVVVDSIEDIHGDIIDTGIRFYYYQFLENHRTTYHVYFNENDTYCGFSTKYALADASDASAEFMNLSGYFPETALVVRLHSSCPIANNISTYGIANWYKLNKLVAFIFISNANGSTASITATEMDLSGKPNLETLILVGCNISLDAAGISKKNFPFLKMLQWKFSRITMPMMLPFTISNCPPISKHIDFTQAGLSDHDVDQILIGLATSLQYIVPNNGTYTPSIAITDGNAARTGLSTGAVTILNMKGWSIT